MSLRNNLMGLNSVVFSRIEQGSLEISAGKKKCGVGIIKVRLAEFPRPLIHLQRNLAPGLSLASTWTTLLNQGVPWFRWIPVLRYGLCKWPCSPTMKIGPPHTYEHRPIHDNNARDCCGGMGAVSSGETSTANITGIFSPSSMPCSTGPHQFFKRLQEKLPDKR